MKGRTKNVDNYCDMHEETIIPIQTPHRKAARITMNASYMNTCCPWRFVKPMLRRTPYSQMLSLTF